MSSSQSTLDTEDAIPTGTPELLCRRDERVAVVTLNRPEARNALTLEMKRALVELIPRLGDDSEVGCLLLTGAGASFCSGGDTKKMAEDGSPTDPEERKRLLRFEHRIPASLHALGKPVIAALPGPAAGAGFGIALAADLRIAAESAFVTTAYARLGLSGDYGAAWFLTHLVGTARARELLFTARRIGARECAALGLVNEVVADDALESRALEWAREIAAGPPLALRFMKEDLNRALLGDLQSCLDFEAEHMVDSAGTEDYREAVAAFQEKRAPRFQGR
ncbi:MAG: enoyl-CoA hydratase-related protein [Myxococcota bacterium]|nr:enoyl-CoA hydratase-related protein [Myxococcota bacterium]